MLQISLEVCFPLILSTYHPLSHYLSWDVLVEPFLFLAYTDDSLTLFQFNMPLQKLFTSLGCYSAVLGLYCLNRDYVPAFWFMSVHMKQILQEQQIFFFKFLLFQFLVKGNKERRVFTERSKSKYRSFIGGL